MAKPQPSYPMENPMTTREHKYSKDYPRKAKGMSFFAFLFSIVFYISIFYIFNLSPSALFYNPKFWFFISNTLILIIAADYGAFSSTKDKLDLYDEYVMNSDQLARSSAASFVSQYPEIAKKMTSKEEEKVVKEDAATDDHQKKNNEIPEERILEVVKYEPETESPPDDRKGPKDDNEEAAGELVVKKNAPMKTFGRSKSDKAKRDKIVEDKNGGLQRSETQKLEPRVSEENEFSSMSNEELNRRVEEFIQRFNREMRLQARSVRNGQLLLEYE